MKVYASICALALLFQLAVCSDNSSTPVIDNRCCFRYSQGRIPRNLVVDYYRISSRCPLPAIVFITKKGKQICANPTTRWVQDLVSYLEEN
ncbi:C-C motif chemokine 5-like isoform X2 [Sphaerodactylus townsendi]|uniref:C-C motif chemokine 5-like isoform X2 n=1 Tax=Sphaerodactylus townsendi TaxID=933632 RepID=UPI0020262497|nr:C-C motif chemokine 5-like isoform X2 [Sphaerodactylus townsendi]